jgi:hypothetical protein
LQCRHTNPSVLMVQKLHQLGKMSMVFDTPVHGESGPTVAIAGGVRGVNVRATLNGVMACGETYGPPLAAHP